MDRGQIHTLEAFIAALLVVGALLFASQATAVTPLSASTSNQHIENQQQTMGEDLLTLAAANGSLQDALTYFNTTVEDPLFVDSHPEFGYYTGPPPDQHPLHEQLDDAFRGGVYAYNIELRYVDESGEMDERQFIHMGTPSDNAVIATTTVTLFDEDSISYDGSSPETIGEAEEQFWAPNVDSESEIYNVVEVRLTIWRM